MLRLQNGYLRVQKSMWCNFFEQSNACIKVDISLMNYLFIVFYVSRLTQGLDIFCCWKTFLVSKLTKKRANFREHKQVVLFAENSQILLKFSVIPILRVSVQGVKSLGGHFACLCWEFEIYEVLFFKKKMEMRLHF